MAKKLTPAQVKARSKDPRTRTSVPTSQLSPAHRAMRAKAIAQKKKAAALDDPAALTAPMTPRTLAEQVQASTGLAFSNQDQELAGQRGVHQQMQQAIPSWFEAYKASLARGTAVQMAANAQAVAAAQQAGDSAAALDASQRGQQQATMAADAASRGATVDPSIAAQGQQAAASRHASQAAFTGLQAGLGAASTGLAANRETVAAGQQVSAQMGERNVGLNIDRAAKILAQDKGKFATEFRQKLIDAEHTKQLENKAFGLSAAKANADVAIERDKLKAKVKSDKVRNQLKAAELRAQREMDAATRSNNRARIDIARDQLAVAQRRARAYERGQATSSAGGVTVAEQRRRNDAISRIGSDYAKALAAARRAMSNPKLANPAGIGRALDTLFPKLPKAARNKIIGQATGKVTAAQRRSYQSLLDDIRAGKISYGG